MILEKSSCVKRAQGTNKIFVFIFLNFIVPKFLVGISTLLVETGC